MLMLAGLVVFLMVMVLIWDLAGQPTPRRLMRHRRTRRRRDIRDL